MAIAGAAPIPAAAQAAADSARSADDDAPALSYLLRPLPEEGVVEVAGILLGVEATEVVGWGGQKVPRDLKIEVAQGERGLGFRYRVPVPQREFRQAGRPVLNDRYFAAFGDRLFVIPDSGKPHPAIGLEVAAPDGWTIATSRGEGARHTLGGAPDLFGTLICAGDYTVRSFTAGGGGGDAGWSTPVTIAVRGKRPTDDDAFAADIKRLVEGQVRYFGGGHPAPRLFLALHYFPRGKHPDIPAFNRGAPGHDTILGFHPEGRTREDFEFLGMLAHEHLHNWYPNVMATDLGAWFREGLNDYIAYRTLLADGLHDRGQFTGMLTKWYREYLWCMPKGDHPLIPYRQGMIAAWIFDIELRRATGGGAGLSSVLALLLEWRDGGGKRRKASRTEFLHALNAIAGKDLEPLYRELVESPDVVDLPAHLAGSGFRVVDGNVIAIDPSDGQEETFLKTLLDPGPAPPLNYRRPAGDEELRYWLNNMVRHHRFARWEIVAATGLAPRAIDAAIERLGIKKEPAPAPPTGSAPLRVLPYPGGRHPRTGFLDGAVRPQRETKLSVFTPWDPAAYVLVDLPEAIWSNLGLTYLAHTHVPTVWTKADIDLPPLEWKRRDDGSFVCERTLPNGIRFGASAKPGPKALRMELWLHNGTPELLTGLRVQNCVMLKGAPGLAAQTNDNKVLASPFAAGSDATGQRWVITGWEHCHRPWANPPVPCLHADPKFPDCPPGETQRLRGWLSFYQGDDIRAELKRIDATGWREGESE